MAVRGQRILYCASATGPVLLPGFMIDPAPLGRTDQLVVAFGVAGPITDYADESASDVTGTWRADPDYPEAVTAATLVADLDGKADLAELATVDQAVDALIANGALYTAALAQIRDRYPDHYHGLLGLGGDPVGTDGNLDYTLPGDT